MKKVLILVNHDVVIYNFRKELVSKLLEAGNKVFISMPKAEKYKYFSELGCEIIDTNVERRGSNPINDFKLLIKYIKMISSINPDVILTYTIKPNIYGGLAARICNKRIIHTVTGLGSVYIQDMWQKKITIILNKISFKSASKVFFQNKDNYKFYKKLGIISEEKEFEIVPGSGVNLKDFPYVEKSFDDKIKFTFIGRILKDKGIEEYLIAAKEINKIYKSVEFEVVGFIEENKYFPVLEEYEKNGIIKYLGRREDIFEIMCNSNCIILPSYGEGRGTVLQEGAAVGRPLITCDTYGCKENVEDGVNGFLCKVADTESLINAIKKFIELTREQKITMGKKSREKAEKEFNREIVIEAYLKEVNSVK